MAALSLNTTLFVQSVHFTAAVRGSVTVGTNGCFPTRAPQTQLVWGLKKGHLAKVNRLKKARGQK